MMRRVNWRKLLRRLLVLRMVIWAEERMRKFVQKGIITKVRALGDQAGGTVAVAQVEIEDGASADFSTGDQGVEGDEQAIEGKKSSAEVGGRMMEAADEGGGDLVMKGLASGGGASIAAGANGRIKVGGPREILGLSEVLRGCSLNGLQIFCRMNSAKFDLG